VPHLVVWGMIVQGQLVFIATEFISGIELCPRKFNSCFLYIDLLQLHLLLFL
jgi:hypothetical protein